KLRQWGLSRNFSAKEKAKAAKDIRQLSVKGQKLPTAVMVGGRRLPIGRVERQVRHDPEYLTTFVRRKYKPRVSAPRPSLKGAGHDLDTERILLEITYYYPTVLTRGYSPQHDRAPCTDIIMQRIPAAKQLLKRGFSAAAWKEVAIACDVVHRVFRGQTIELLPDLFVLFMSNSWTNHKALYGVIIKYFAHVAKIAMGEQHPISNILTMMQSRENWDRTGEVVLGAMLDLMKTRKKDMGPIRLQNMYRLETQYLDRVKQSVGLEARRKLQEEKLAEWQGRLGPRNQHALGMKHELVVTYERLSLLDKAEAYLDEIVSQGRVFADDASLFGVYPLAANELAKYHFRKSRYADAEEVLNLAASWLENRQVAERYICVEVGEQLAALDWMKEKGLI
ncbi:uncharacterized protein A1O9_05698, partial [Exophiala aquamarina CBS 119918]